MSTTEGRHHTGGTPPRVSAWWLALGVLALCVATYFQTWRELWPVWMDTDRTSYTHGVLVVIVSAWLVWRLRPELQDVPIRPACYAIPAVIGLSFLWLIASSGGIFTLHTAVWPLLTLAIVLAACGWRVARKFAFPLAYLWFAVTAWDYLIGPLQRLTILVVDQLNAITKVPGVVVGNSVILPNGVFEIVGGCSGLHFLVVGLAIATLAGEVQHDRPGIRLLLIVIMTILALLTNWLRVYFIILAGYLTDMQHYLVTVDHYKFGWAVFALALIGFFLILSRMPASVSTDGTAIEDRQRPVHWLRGYGLAIIAATALPLVSMTARAVDRGKTVTPFVAPQVEGYGGPANPSPVWQPAYVGPEAEIRVAYVAPTGRVIDYYGNRYLDQSQGRELVGYDNVLLDPHVFYRVRERRTTRGADGSRMPAVELTVELRSGQQWAVMYHYRVGDQVLTSGLATQLSAGFWSLWSRVPAGIDAVATPCSGDCDAAMGDISSLLAAL